MFENRYPDVVYEIHREFNTAADNLLEEANQIIKKAETVNEGKVERLIKLGFKKVQEIVLSKEALEQKKYSEEISKIVKSYQYHYPQNKFITEEQVKTICEKYGLVLGRISDYIGFVPEKNLKEIENFKLKDEHQSAVFRYSRAFGRTPELTLQEIIFEYSDAHGEESIINWAKTHSPVRRKKDEYRICAPLKDFDMKADYKVLGHRVVKVDEDPIVLQPLPDGYLIVTAWGNESSDPIVQNGNLN